VMLAEPARRSLRAVGVDEGMTTGTRRNNVLGKGSTSCRPCGASRTSSRGGYHEERFWFRGASICCVRDHARSLFDPEDVRVEHEIVVRRRFPIDAVETLQVVAAPGIGLLDLASRLVGVDPL